MPSDLVVRSRETRQSAPNRSMANRSTVPKRTDGFAETFAALGAILEPHAKRMTVTVDEPGHYELASPTMTDRVGRPLFCASVQINKNYVSYHLMPVYISSALRDSLPAALRRSVGVGHRPRPRAGRS